MNKVKQTIVFDYDDVLAPLTMTVLESQIAAEIDVNEELTLDEFEEKLITFEEIQGNFKLFCDLYEKYGPEFIEKAKATENFYVNVHFQYEAIDVLNQLRKDYEVVALLEDINQQRNDEKINWLISFLGFTSNHIIYADRFEDVTFADYYISANIKSLERVNGKKILFNYPYNQNENSDSVIRVMDWAEVLHLFQTIDNESVVISKRHALASSRVLRPIDLRNVCQETDNFNEVVENLYKEECLILLYFTFNEGQISTEPTLLQSWIHNIIETGATYISTAYRYNYNDVNTKVLLVNYHNREIGLMGVCTFISKPYIQFEKKYLLNNESTDTYQVDIKIEALITPNSKFYKTINWRLMCDLGIEEGINGAKLINEEIKIFLDALKKSR